MSEAGEISCNLTFYETFTQLLSRVFTLLRQHTFVTSWLNNIDLRLTLRLTFMLNFIAVLRNELSYCSHHVCFSLAVHTVKCYVRNVDDRARPRTVILLYVVHTHRRVTGDYHLYITDNTVIGLWRCSRYLNFRYIQNFHIYMYNMNVTEFRCILGLQVCEGSFGTIFEVVK